ncbi:MAG: PAS domain S-box protein, partial [Syntrophales bacterium]|nr:PAS domain S-box protein [Syntrophales bacterium]
MFSRVDAGGQIQHAAPYDPRFAGGDISGLKHFQALKKSLKPQVSEVTLLLRGFQAVVIQVPVFREGRFDGAVSFAVSFEALAKEFLESIRIGDTGYAWMISRDGTELYCPVPGHIGKNVSETCKGFPDLLAIAENMMKGKAGTATYTYNRVRENEKEIVIKHAVYLPVRLGNTAWSIIVATPEDEIVAAMESFRNRLLAVLALLLAAGLIAGYAMLRIWWVAQEQRSRREAEEALRASEEKYRHIFEHAVEGIFQSTPEGRYLSVNPALARMSGYASPEEMISSVTDIRSQLYVNPAQRDEYKRKLEAAGHLENFEFLAKDRNGNPICMSVNARVVKDADGKILFYEGTQEDITRRRQAEEALKAANRKLNDIIEFLPDATFVVDKDKRVIAWNRAIEEMTGVKKEEIVGKGDHIYTVPFYGEARPNVLDLIDGYDPDIERKYRYIKRRGDVLYGEVFVPKVYGGRGAHVWAIVAPLFDSEGKQAGAIESVRDITEFKDAEAALRQSEENYRLVIENSRDAIFILQNECIQFPNPRTQQLLGCTVAELREMVFANSVHPKDRNMAALQQKEILAGRGGNATFRIVASDGRVLWVENSAVAVRWKEQPATLNFMRDITAQKNIEAQLQNAQKMEAIGTLAGGIAHDFNNLLMSVNGYAALMLHDLEKRHPHFDLLKKIEEQVRSGADLTKQLLGFARGGRYEVKALDLNEVVEKSSTLFGRTRKEIAIHRRLQPDLWGVEADRGQLEQVMLNLFVNAWHAMPEGGSLYLDTRNVDVEEDYVKPFDLKAGRYVRISVTDTGIGMDEKTRKRIFEPFFTTKEMGRGVGLGLASVYGIVRGHRGFINVYSEKDKGTTFNIYLPASDRKPEIK